MIALRRPFRRAVEEPPSTDENLLRRLACKRFIRKQSLKAAGVSALPVPGADLFINGQLLASTLEQINAAHGLSRLQIAMLPPALRSQVENVVNEVGSYLIGRAITQAAVFAAARGLGIRIGMQQAAKLAPVAGLAASAVLSGWMFKRLCERHVAQCERVRAALPLLPAPPVLPRLDFQPPAP